MEESKARQEIIEVCQRLYRKEYVTAYDGNVSIRLGPNRFLVTPSGFCKGDLTENDLIICNKHGEKLQGDHRITSEFPMHLKAYQLRDDINAVVHAHPPLATSLSLAGISLARCILPEVILSLGSIPTTSYATPTTPEGADVITELIPHYDAIILDRHGSLTVGKTAMAAYYKLEKIEHTAKITITARQLGTIKTLEPMQLETISQLARQMGVKEEAIIKCYECGACGKGSDENAQLADQITGLVLKQLTKSDGPLK